MIPVIDLFAGPGGLGEGFSECSRRRGGRAFKIAFSVEKEYHAYRTLRLRAFYRSYRHRGVRTPESYYKVLRGELPPEELEACCPDAWSEAENEAIHAELGSQIDDECIGLAVRQHNRSSGGGPSVLIGGPPCQAYSLVGRARNSRVEDSLLEQDSRHFLYRQYLQIIAKTWPAVFVMENVKGILSSRMHQDRIFPRILDDLHDPARAIGGPLARSGPSQRYHLVPVSMGTSEDAQGCMFENREDPSRFVVHCEDYGIPQRRHRVFIVGLREDLRGVFAPPAVLPGLVSVRDVIKKMPRIRSDLSRRGSANSDWSETIQDGMTRQLLSSIGKSAGNEIATLCAKVANSTRQQPRTTGAEFVHADDVSIANTELHRWIIDPRLDGVCNHKSKAHMPADLIRYVFIAAYGQVMGRSPTLADFPDELLPHHKNVSRQTKATAVFNDRFRVQVWNEPSSTITSHIAKDGHYFVHPDPRQCRSLTVREAARLQTFPDKYFCGLRGGQSKHSEGAAEWNPSLVYRRGRAMPYDPCDGYTSSMVA